MQAASGLEAQDRAQQVRRVLSRVTAISAGFADEDAADSLPPSPRPSGPDDYSLYGSDESFEEEDEEEDPNLADEAERAAAMAEEARRVAAQLDEISATEAWLSEQASMGERELASLARQTTEVEADAQRLEKEAAEAEAHAEILSSHIERRQEVMTSLRGMLESSHIASAQQIQQLRERISAELDAHAAIIERTVRNHIMDRFKATTEVWLREASLTWASLKLGPQDDEDGDGVGGDHEEIGAALHAASHGRGALVSRVNASRIELSALGVKLRHVLSGAAEEARVAAARRERKLADLRTIESHEVETQRGRDSAVALIASLIGCASRAEAALLEWLDAEAEEEERAAAAALMEGEESGGRGGKRGRGGGGGGGAGGGRFGGRGSGAGLHRLGRSSSSSSNVADESLRSAQFRATRERREEVVALLRQVQSGGGGEKHKVPRPGDDTLSEDEAMRLAVQRVLSRREERSSRWMALLRNQNVKHELPPNPDAKTGNEATERKRAERRLAKLEAELRSVERAVAF